ncbi:uncharacterized protein LOC127728991 [Mytilus californianus]|uniref:uncharacterized protein LOC127728991 n=1 Tax=Mytilus californianus TaxID=6549 RepID=UPI0022461767|nr:uncharacterized protein LOC127728991 [Mytilus californianus]
MSTSSTSTLKHSSITTASTTITSTKTTRKTTIASPSTTANPKVSQSTTIKPTTLTSVTHKIFPTGKASNYDTRDPLDCKRALLIVPCTNAIVKKHCFYSCNSKQGNSLLSSTNTTPFRQTTIMTSQQTTSILVAVNNVQTTHISSVSTHMSAVNIYVSPNSQSSLSNMLSLQSNTRSNYLSAIQSTPTSMLPSSISIGVSSFQYSNILHTSMTTQNTIVSSLISPMSSAIALMSVTPPNVVSSSVTHVTHNVLPTGQASIYNPLDPLDCKRSLLIFSCSMPLVAKHCHYSCSSPSFKFPSSSIFHSSASGVAHSQNSDKTSSVSMTCYNVPVMSSALHSSPTSTFSKAISSATRMSNFSTSTKPNLSKSTQSLKSIQISTSTTKPLTSMSTKKPSKVMSTTKPSTKPSTSMSTTKLSTSISTKKPSTSMSTPSSLYTTTTSIPRRTTTTTTTTRLNKQRG